MSKISVEQWMELFQEIGLKDDDMKKWHRLFEAKNPERHQSFLEWLGLNATQISVIRSL